jgi:hypothetical protein
MSAMWSKWAWPVDNHVGSLDVVGPEPERPVARSSVVPGVEQDHLITEGDLVVGAAKPAQREGVGALRRRPADGGRHERVQGRIVGQSVHDLGA